MFAGQRDNIAVFIDGANLYATAKLLRFEIDYAQLLSYYNRRGRLVRASYYTAVLGDDQPNSLKPLVDYLTYNGYHMVTKEAKSFTNEITGLVKIKGNMDIELALDVIKLAQTGRVDTVVIFSGDGDFRSVVEMVQDMAVRVEIVSTNKTKPSMVADELRRQADEFIDLMDLKEHLIRRAPSTVGY